jgi:predicted tellurium resistance membrane protein TerC
MLAVFQDTWSWTQIPKIVLIDLLLAGDNAIVIAMAVRLLPPREQRLGARGCSSGRAAHPVLTVATWLLEVRG